MRRKQKGPPEGGPFMWFYRLDQVAADLIAQQRGPMQPRPVTRAIVFAQVESLRTTESLVIRDARYFQRLTRS
jgi:hypothetical protein